MTSDVRRALPAVGLLADSPLVREACRELPRAVVVDAARAVIERVRRDPHHAPDSDEAWARSVASEAHRRALPSLRPCINATGVVLHTNLGRAPLAPAAIAAIVATAGGSVNLEYDLATGARGSRYAHCTSLLCELTGAEEALVVNNCAAALVLALNTLAEGREALVSRGELIEIGGSFRVPDIMAKSGAILCEVGTTNRTHVADYRQAVGSNTGAIVKVHRSNFEVRGFVAEASVAELAGVAREAGLPLLFDFGSGLLLSLERYGLAGESTAADAVAAGATLTVMSGDKLLGGPQAGIILGSHTAVSACRNNPLTRALRVDKLTIAALSATLALYRDPERAVREIPALAMLTTPGSDVRTRAERVAARVSDLGVDVRVEPTEASVGGGAFPTARIPSHAVSLGGDASAIEARLRGGALPIIARIADGRILLDLRSVLPDTDDDLTDALRAALAHA